MSAFAIAAACLLIAIACTIVLRALSTLANLFIEHRATLTASKPLSPDSYFDFIVCGGGSAGCVVAARLVEQGFSVLLLEVGEEDRDSVFFKLPMAALGFQGTRHHWGYETRGEEALTMKGKHWGLHDGCRGRPLIQCRGRVLGGSSSLNLCNWIRGHPAEYDAWEREHGAEGWSYSSLLPHFQRAESLHGPPAHDDLSASRDCAPPAGRDEPAVLVERLASPHTLTASFVRACRAWLGTDGPSHMLS